MAELEPALLENGTGHQRRISRFTLRTFLLLVALVAAGLAVFVQQRRITKLQMALWRYEAEATPVALAADEVRIISRTITDTDHLKVVTYRFETATDHFATVFAKGDSSGSSAQLDPHTNLYVTESVFVFDYLESMDRLKIMTKVDGASGYSLTTMPKEFSLDKDVQFREIDETYPRQDRVELFEVGDRVYSLELK